jgi:hypothetical protein
MKVRYNPDKNLEARLIRQLINKQEDITAEEICNQLNLILSDLSEIILRLEDFQLIEFLDCWPLKSGSKILLHEHDLVAGKDYDVLLIAFGSYRILSEGSGPESKPEPYQFHRELFEVSDCNIPNGWVAEWFDGELSIHPPGWDNSLFADYFDGKAKAKKRFLSELKIYFPETYQRWKAKT